MRRVTLQPPPGRLQLLLQRTSEEVFEPEAATDVPLVRFSAYTARQHVYGWVRLRADRLTDLLNAHDELQLLDIEVETLGGNLLGTLDEILIARDELIAVQASAPRGQVHRRVHTRTYPLAVQAGQYLMYGHLHVPPGLEPLEHARTRPPMIPLTDAVIEFWEHGNRRHQSSGTIVFNREAVDSMRLVADDDLIEGLLQPE